ncbi:MAG: hypothetical protein WCJ86_04025 [Candidatus Saccharibacteria bacterium]
MNKSIKKFLITVSAVGALLFPALTPSLVGAADVSGNLCSGTQLVATGGAPCTDAGSNNTIQSVVDLIVNLLSLVVGLLSVIFLIFGAFKYITSGGDSGKVTSAKSTILYALIGLVIVAIAQVIVRVVVGKASTIV